MSLRRRAKKGFVWTFAQQFGNQVIGFTISLILARILLPEEFGLIGMIAIFVAIGNTLLNAGLTQSLIRSEELEEADYSTVFYFNLVSATAVYILVYVLAPLIASFYEQPILTDIVRLYCLSFIFSAFAAVQLARLTKRMDFKTQTLVALPATITGGAVGIIMAYSGYGVWSLVWSSLITSFLSSVQLWFYSKWKPGFIFSREKFKVHFNFGYKLTLSGLLNRIFDNIFIIVIGKYFSAAQVGFYTRAETTKQLPLSNIFNSLDRITYPMFAEIQNDDVRLKRVYKQLLQMVLFVVAPLLIFLAVLGEPAFRFLFTEKWLPAVPYFQILCVTGILYPLHAYNLSILNVKGRSDLFLKLEVLKKVVIVLTILVTIPFGILALLYGQVFISLVSFFINSHYTSRFIKYPAWHQLKDVLPVILLALAAGAVIYAVDRIGINDQPDILRIIIGGLSGIIVYLGIAYLLKLRSLFELSNLIFKK
ncbi:lipopolysaccharide biosynthesis protein [Antarcticibacterium flavum]|uniref:Lipopolysaccharide biosynthesis protein n=1 Tax=Antarcticibacterium flavum TaxID=2058175 RepID=A0A5B7X1W6_9FLAO|nr:MULTISPECIES: lipopolysaccharide biosynthesis protein [Antarcticibacterium]MCM4158791.1 flippase [Antarcticibacterium sp. W02-3]QCY68641.1 lipopolysaccharide biosynthesis protein [Antarcticibacterium flavum]